MKERKRVYRGSKGEDVQERIERMCRKEGTTMKIKMLDQAFRPY